MTNQIAKVVFENELTQAGLDALKDKYPSTLVFDMTNDETFKEARKTRTEMNKLKEAIDRRRIDVCKDIKTHGDDLIKQIETIYSVVVKPFELEDDRRKKEAEEKQRAYDELISKERKAISEILNWVQVCRTMPSDEIQNIIEAVDMIDESGFHKDLIHEAIEAKKNTIAQLGQFLQQTMQSEALAAQAKEANLKLSIEQAINRLKMLPMDYMGKPSAGTFAKIDELKSFTPAAEKFGERTQEAIDSLATVIQQLTMIANQAEAMEKIKPPAAPTEIELAAAMPFDGGVVEKPRTLKCAISSWADRSAISNNAYDELIAIVGTFNVLDKTVIQ